MKFAAVLSFSIFALAAQLAQAQTTFEPAVLCTALVQENGGLAAKEMEQTQQQDGATTFHYIDAAYEMYATYNPGIDAVAASIQENQSKRLTEVSDVQPTNEANIVEIVDGAGNIAAAIACQYQ
jgi:hypothetical protein